MTTESKIPKFANYQEEAHFWDTHDFSDFDDETVPVEVQVASKLSEIIPIRLAPDIVLQLENEAERLGVGTSTLIKIWVLERLQRLPESNGKA